MIQVIKLSTGEELIGEVEASDKVTRISKPCALQWMPSRANPDQPMMGLIPYAAYVDGHNIIVKNEQVVWSGKPVTALYNQYNSIFGTGIQLAGL